MTTEMTGYETKLRDEFAKIAFAALLADTSKHARATNTADSKGESVYDFWLRLSYLAADKAMEARNAK